MKRVLALVLSIVLALSLFSACSNTGKALTAAELLDLGEKHLLETDYEQALVQFLKVIEIEPMIPRGYTGAAEAYVGLGQKEEAIKILEKGLEALPGNEEITTKLEEIHALSSQPNENSQERTPTEEEIQYYNNLTDRQKELLETIKDSLLIQNYQDTKTIMSSNEFTDIFNSIPGTSGNKVYLPIEMQISYNGISYFVETKPVKTGTGDYFYAIYRVWNHDGNKTVDFYYSQVQYKDGKANGPYFQIFENGISSDGDGQIRRISGQALDGFKHGDEFTDDCDRYNKTIRYDWQTLSVYDKGKIVPFGYADDGSVYVSKVVKINNKGWFNFDLEPGEFISSDVDVLDKIESFDELFEEF